MHNLEDLIATQVAAGLKRKSVTTPARWAETYRVMGGSFPGSFGFRHHPWLREMHETKAERNVGQKAAQVGYTEWAMNMVFFSIDVKGIDSLYILPTEGDASDFSAARFDPALELSPHLKGMFSDVKNVGLKRAGQASLYVRGSRSRSKLKSIPAGCIVFDEVDEMYQKNITLAEERASGQLFKQNIKLSTPTVDGFGINGYFQDSTQEHFHFKCPRCGVWTELEFPACLEITAEGKSDSKIKNSYLKCQKCSGTLNHKEKPDWLAQAKFVPQYTDRDMRGFYVNQLYSPTIAPWEFALSYLRSLEDPTDEQEFWNSKVGVPHVIGDARINDALIQACTGNYKNGSMPQQRYVTMGIDVGKHIHWIVCEWILPSRRTPGLDINDEARCRILAFGVCDEWGELDRTMHKFSVLSAVVDRHPETRNARSFCTRFFGRAYMCMYGRGVNGKHIHPGKDDEHTVSVDRTTWLDQSLGRFHNQTVAVPVDLSDDFKKQIKEPIRVYERDANGNPVGRYVNVNADHFAHAFNYAEIALPFAVGQGAAHDLRERVF